MPKSREQQCRGYAKFDIKFDEGKGVLNPFGDKQSVRQALEKEIGDLEQNQRKNTSVGLPLA